MITRLLTLRLEHNRQTRMKKQVLFSVLCAWGFALCGCSTTDTDTLSEAGGGLQLSMSRAADGETATVAGFKADGTLSFSKEAYSNGTQWLWRDGNAPSQTELAQVAATQPLVTINTPTKSLNQSELAGYPKGLKLGVTPLADYLTHGVAVKQCLAKMQISCEGSYFLNYSINLYLGDRATLDFTKGTLSAISSKSLFTQAMENQKNATLTILPQTFRKGELLFSYQYGDSYYSYTLKEDITVGANQCIHIKIASGDEDVYTPPAPDPNVTITVTGGTQEMGSDTDTEWDLPTSNTGIDAMGGSTDEDWKSEQL